MWLETAIKSKDGWMDSEPNIAGEKKSSTTFQGHSEGFKVEVGDGARIELGNGFSQIHRTVHSAHVQ